MYCHHCELLLLVASFNFKFKKQASPVPHHLLIIKKLYKMKRNIFPVCLVIILIISSCRKLITIAPSPNLVETSSIFENDKTAISAVMGIYVQMRASTTHFTNNGMSIYGGLLADEIYNTASSSSYDPFYTNTLLPTTSAINGSFYSLAYKNIYTINSILEGLANSVSITDSVKKQLTGEMKTARGFYYFYLTNLFGEVPLVLNTDYRENALLPRTATNIVYDQIRNDLLDAITLLKPGYPSAGKARPNKWTATALLARVYLFEKNWAAAESAASQVINGGYSLVSNLNNVFLINSAETIWELASGNDAANTAQGSAYIPSSATVKPSFAIGPNLLAAFETGDTRKTSWLKSNTVSSVIYYYPNKYKVRTNTPVTEYNVVFRLAEQYLIRAEARAMLNNITGAEQDLNLIRTRAGLSANTGNTQSSLLTAIEKERQTELFTEWGDRWLQVKRTNRADAVLSILKGSNWQSHDVLFPIPYNELQYNVYLVQNPGY
jgi:hypothetical protein